MDACRERLDHDGRQRDERREHTSAASTTARQDTRCDASTVAVGIASPPKSDHDRDAVHATAALVGKEL